MTVTAWLPGKRRTATLGTLSFRNVHRRSDCRGRACVVHHPSDHHMRDWPLHWREDRGICERLCPHGIGHPDPDQPGDSTHGCDFCCLVPA